jgi:hypothetical protein
MLELEIKRVKGDGLVKDQEARINLHDQLMFWQYEEI